MPIRQSTNQKNLGVVLITHAVATWFMVGMIWTIHILNYPQLGIAGKITYGSDNEYIYDALQSEHVDRIGKLLIFPWISEGITLIAILGFAFLGPYRRLRIPALINSAAMSIVLLISGIWSAPAHGKLLDRFDPDVYDTLMSANFVRTLAWTLCGITSILLLTNIRGVTNSDERSQ